eukprot:957446-Pyramimonas_sp.AAC.1
MMRPVTHPSARADHALPAHDHSTPPCADTCEALQCPFYHCLDHLHTNSARYQYNPHHLKNTGE